MKTVKKMISIILLGAFLMSLPFSICACTKSPKENNKKDDNDVDGPADNDPQNGPDRDYFVTGLKADGYVDNMYAGIVPTFSWRAESDRRGARQSEYRILIAEKEEDLIAGSTKTVWDSGSVKSDAQNAAYTGAPLDHERQYVWKVIVTDERGAAHYSETGIFNTELDPAKPFGGAEWIGADPENGGTDSYTVEARFKIVSNSSGLVFSATDSNNFYLWQLNAVVRPGKIIFRPHKWQNGSISVMTEVDVSQYMSAGEGFGGWHVMKVEVAKREFRTSIDGELVHTLTDASPLPSGSLGIRNVQSADDNQVTHYDYITLTDSRTGAVIQSEDFSSGDETELAFNCGTVKDGIYIVRGNQLSFIAGKASFDWLLENNVEAETRRKGEIVKDFITKEVISLDDRLELRGMGLIWGIDFGKINPELSEQIIEKCFEQKLICECAGRDGAVLKIMPPLVIEDDLLMKGLEIIANAAKEALK